MLEIIGIAAAILLFAAIGFVLLLVIHLAALSFERCPQCEASAESYEDKHIPMNDKKHDTERHVTCVNGHNYAYTYRWPDFDPHSHHYTC